MSKEPTKQPSNPVESMGLLESLLKFVEEGTLLPDREFESGQTELWWYEDRDELIRKIKAHLKDSND